VIDITIAWNVVFIGVALYAMWFTWRHFVYA
jgi:hypothetical protein